MKPRQIRIAALPVAATILALVPGCGTDRNVQSTPNPTPSLVEVQVGRIYELTTAEQTLARSSVGAAGVTTTALSKDGFFPTGKVEVNVNGESSSTEWHIVVTRCASAGGEQLFELEAERLCNQRVNTPTFDYPRIDRVMTMTPNKHGQVAFGAYLKQPTLYPYPFGLKLVGKNGSKKVTVNCLSLRRPYDPSPQGAPGTAQAMASFGKNTLGRKPGTYYLGLSQPPVASCDVS